MLTSSTNLVLKRNNQCPCGQQINQNNISSEPVKQWWRRSLYLLLLDVKFAEMKPRFCEEKRSHS